MPMTSLKRTASDDNDFRTLVALLDADLRIRDGEEHGFYAQFNGIAAIKEVIVAYIGDEPVACGAFKPYDAHTAEVKRMFVQPAFRGRGCARQVLQALEAWAAELGFAACILETGKKQPEAIRLYEKGGYHYIPNYGQYAGVENSVCMQKNLLDA